MEVLMNTAKLMEMIAVTMVLPAVLRCHRERGEERPPSFFFLGLPLDGERIPPLVLGLYGSRRAGAPSRLDLPSSVSLCFRDFLELFLRPSTVSFIDGDP